MDWEHFDRFSFYKKEIVPFHVESQQRCNSENFVFTIQYTNLSKIQMWNDRCHHRILKTRIIEKNGRIYITHCKVLRRLKKKKRGVEMNCCKTYLRNIIFQYFFFYNLQTGSRQGKKNPGRVLGKKNCQNSLEGNSKICSSSNKTDSTACNTREKKLQRFFGLLTLKKDWKS